MSGAEARKAARGTYLLQAAAALAPSCPALAREAGRAALSLFAREARAEGALLSQLRPLLSRVCGGCGGALADPHTATVSICTVRDAARLQRTVRAEGGAVVSTLRTARDEGRRACAAVTYRCLGCGTVTLLPALTRVKAEAQSAGPAQACAAPAAATAAPPAHAAAPTAGLPEGPSRKRPRKGAAEIRQQGPPPPPRQQPPPQPRSRSGAEEPGQRKAGTPVQNKERQRQQQQPQQQQPLGRRKKQHGGRAQDAAAAPAAPTSGGFQDFLAQLGV
eukprot:TRINITY_DN17186_c0_g1_i2.p1 TRINITY_DN17186_c0_g1~~TRINITY_DN17186_c0_g1_i2.p1  ORF type:complete len:299 (+),score=68.58 TRINITY_DN17186_c0_g1_i2:72-899(+)